MTSSSNATPDADKPPGGRKDPDCAVKCGQFEGGMVDSSRFTASDRANQVVFVEALGKNERALVLVSLVVAVGMSAYSLAKVTGSVELQAQRSQQQAATYALAQSQAAQTYALATEQLARTYQTQAEQTRDTLKQLQTQSRVTELKLDDYNVTLRRAGIRLKGDFTRGPVGNPDAESFNMKLPKNPQIDSR